MNAGFLGLCVLYSGSLFLPGVEEHSRETAQLSRYIWSGMRDHRERLQRGVFHANGRKVFVDPDWGQLEEEVSIFCAFDQGKSSIRFDRLEREKSVTVRPGIKPGHSGAHWDTTPSGGKSLKIGGKVLRWQLGGKAAAIGSGESIPLVHQVHPFDVRTLGLTFWQDLEDGVPLQTYLSVYSKIPNEVVAEGDGVYRLGWTEGGSAATFRRTLWLDETKGFSPIRFEYRPQPAHGMVQKGNGYSIISEVTWTRIAELWVPKTFRIEERFMSKRMRSYELAFTWESVNQSIPDDLFTVEGLGLPAGTRLVDTRLHKPIVVGAVGEDPFVETVDAPPEPPGGHGFPWPVFLVGVALLVIVLALAFQYARFRWLQSPGTGLRRT